MYKIVEMLAKKIDAKKPKKKKKKKTNVIRARRAVQPCAYWSA